MNALILHHYDISPYAEKIRAILGFKGLAWKSVHIPIVMPKPDLTTLTGGYRLTPVLQIGADIYCDTKVIARRIEREKPQPTLYPKNTAALERAVSLWGESTFMPLVIIGLGSGAFQPDFVADRQKMIPGGFAPQDALALVPSRIDHIRAVLDLLEKQLADGRPFVLGAECSLADFSVYHPLWAMRGNPAGQAFFAPLANVRAWIDRVAAFGHGTPQEMTAQDAIRIARESTPAMASAADPDDPNGRQVGQRFRVFPEAYGRDPVVGELVSADAHEIAIRRHDQRVGEVVVHFPKEGVVILPEAG